MNDPNPPYTQTFGLDRNLTDAIESSLDVIRVLQNDICREDPHMWQRNPMQLFRLLGTIKTLMKSVIGARNELSARIIEEYVAYTQKKGEAERTNIDVVQEAAAIIRERKKNPRRTTLERKYR